MMDVSVIIINYNTADLIANCLHSILSQEELSFEIIVVDNCSNDNSLQELKRFSSLITLIANVENKGFGRANNQAFALSQGKYIFLLNPDAILTSPYDLKHLIEFMEHEKDYGLIGTRITDNKGKLMKTHFDHYPRQDQSGLDFRGLPGKIASVLGASMLVRRDVFTLVNGFDEDYFLYAEETDLCLRIRKAGFKIGYHEAVTVEHIGGASERRNSTLEVMRKKKLAKYLFYSKHYSARDLKNIAKADLHSAQRKIWGLKLKKLFWGLSEYQAMQYLRYKQAYRIAQGVLVNFK